MAIHLVDCRPVAQELDPRIMQRMRGRMELFFGAPFGSPEAAASEKELGLDQVPGGYYYAFRAAPMGAVSAAVVESTFFGFSTRAVQAVVPAIWATAWPEAVFLSHRAAVDGAMQRRLGEIADSVELKEAAELLHTAVGAADVAGRPLAAGHKGLPWPAAPHVAVWHGMNVLREHRGDGHIAVLVGAGLDAPQSHILLAAGVAAECDCHVALRGRGDLSETLRTSRSHSRDAWATATSQLAARGLFTDDGQMTDSGKELHAEIERKTDQLAAGPWRALGDDGLAALDQALRPATRALAGSQ
jgi:hypothetical protein